jgi:spore germination cell wall hydrolase CwlJ-like protein
MGLVLLGVTSCLKPDHHDAVAPHRPAARDAHALVQALAPGVDAQALAALPTVATGGVAATPDAAPAFLMPVTDGDDAARARDCLTAAVYYEAASEPIEGQRAVAQVVLNRVRSRAFPHSVCGVVYQGVGSGHACQFSFACDGSMDRPRSPSAWATAERVAIAALNGSVMAEVGDATFYHANYVLPWWASSLTRLGSIGRHIFYRWPTALERTLGLTAGYAGAEPDTPVLAGATSLIAGDFGVTVHRGGDTPEPTPIAATASAAEPIAAVAHAVHISVPSAFTAGVHIHRGEDQPVDEGDGA